MKIGTKRTFRTGIIIFAIALLTIAVTLNSCTKEELNTVLTDIIVQSLASWNAQNEKLNEIPQDLDINDNTAGIPSSMDGKTK